MTWCRAVADLPRKQTRVLTWPIVTVFGFIAQPKQHMFMKPNTMRAAARVYGFDLDYQSRPNWDTYGDLLALAARVRLDQRELGPRVKFELVGDVLALGRNSGDLPGMVESGELAACYMSTVRFAPAVPELQVAMLTRAVASAAQRLARNAGQ